MHIMLSRVVQVSILLSIAYASFAQTSAVAPPAPVNLDASAPAKKEAPRQSFKNAEPVVQTPVAATPSAAPTCVAPLRPAPPAAVVEDPCACKPPLTPPLVWGCNGEHKLQFSGDMRFRYEHWKDRLLSRESDDDGNAGFMRTRLNFDYTDSCWTRVFVQILDAREWWTEHDYWQEDHFDVHQAFVEFANKEQSPWSLRIGRQELAFGDQLLVGASQWYNIINTFDGVRATYNDPAWDISFFATQPVTHLFNDEGFFSSGNAERVDDEYFYGMYATYKCWAPHLLDVYLMGLSDTDEHRIWPPAPTSEFGEFGTSDRYIVGTRLTGFLFERPGCGKLLYGAELAHQFGDQAGDDIDAYIGHLYLNYLFEHPWKPMLGIEGLIATGDDELGDGESGRWNPLFANPDVPLGIGDFTPPMNLRMISLRGSISPTEKLTLLAEWHNLWLDSKTDVWVNGFGQFMGIDPTGKSGREMGQELDLTASYKVNECLSFDAGVAHFFAGDFAENVGRGDDANIFFLQTVFKF